MGQYFKAVILSEDGTHVRTYVRPSGSKLMEHSYFGNKAINTIIWLLSEDGMYYKCRIVWAGDYAEPESGSEDNLFRICSDDRHEMREQQIVNFSFPISYRYLLNYTKNVFVDLDKSKSFSNIHPLPILTYEGEQAYYGTNEHLSGTWVRDIIGLQHTLPQETFKELVCDFREFY
jgi:hypothetical protein